MDRQGIKIGVKKLIQRLQIRITGMVQGVGFRPHVWRLAHRYHCTGWIVNDSAGVLIEIQGSADQLSAFQSSLVNELPPLAAIDSFTKTARSVIEEEFDFEICQSQFGASTVAWVSPDLGICGDCLRELHEPTDPRFGYPFINCTNCGPRYTIIRSLPYDRLRTTMDRFEMCQLCRSEYQQPTDRRFHAEPIACPRCGPAVWLELSSGDRQVQESFPQEPPEFWGDMAILETRRQIAAGKIIAIKGIGGFHLACDAFQESAVQQLRAKKNRPHKPLAVMVADLQTAATLADFNPAEARLLNSPARPIVLLRKQPLAKLAPAIAPGNPCLGVLLAYSGLHDLLIRPGECWVMTSGNLSDEPICRLNSEAKHRLSKVADALLFHNRPIQSVCDDSVIRMQGNTGLPIRRSRGYAPLPLRIPLGEGFHRGCRLGVGAELKNTFCLSIQNQAIVSQHIGDLSNQETLTTLTREVENLMALYQIKPNAVAVDLHPGYLSSDWGQRFAGRLGIPLIKVQHHHAHLASLIVEQGIPVDQPIIGCVFDGTGYGSDGGIWGGEWLIGNLQGFQRFAHLEYTSLPGGEGTIEQPARTALAHLFQHQIPWESHLASVRFYGDRPLQNLRKQLQRNFNTIRSSSMGRLFDAVAALLDLRQQVNFEAQGAIELETIAAQERGNPEAIPYSFDVVEFEDPRRPLQLLCPSIFRGILADHQRGVPVPLIAARFHQTIAAASAEICHQARKRTKLNQVGLTGGVFQNLLLTEMLEQRLQELDFQVLKHQQVPPNDGGLALGQVAIASYLRSDPPR